MAVQRFVTIESFGCSDSEGRVYLVERQDVEAKADDLSGPGWMKTGYQRFVSAGETVTKLPDGRFKLVKRNLLLTPEAQEPH